MTAKVSHDAALQELHDRAAGRNAEDTLTIIAGLRELLAQWTAREAAVKAALAEARQGADDAIVAALDAAACERGQHLAQIAILEAELKAAQHQVCAPQIGCTVCAMLRNVVVTLCRAPAAARCRACSRDAE